MSPSDDAPTLALLLRQARTAAALSQRELAERAGVSARAISDLERGLHRTPHLETVRMLADALGLDEFARGTLALAARPRVPSRAVAREWLASLPAPLTTLVGRECEVKALRHTLQDDAVRLLTLTGPGGSGKTRLAIEVARSLGDAFPDGVVFVDLAPLSEPTLVLPAIAQSMVLRETRGIDLATAVRTYLDGKRLLLVLDNVEHLLEAAPLLADLLGALPELTMLATSREPLRLRGEREFRVGPLPLPDPRRCNDPAALGACAAVALFVERAREARADFALTDANAPVVAAICRRLDGLPLALELAAARLRNLSLGELGERLDHALPLLTGGARDAPARHRTLHATIAWSHDLLSLEEQVLFRGLAVFAGGWTLEAAEVVCASDGGPGVLTALGSLTDKNLVRLDESGAVPRYRMLETIREFAAEQLRQYGDHEAALQYAHAAFFTALVSAAESGLCAGVMADVSRVEAELDNLRATLAWLLAAGVAETALRVAAALSEYWTFASGQFSEGRAWLERALALVAGPSESARAGANYGLATMALHQADLPASRLAATAGLSLARSAPDPRWAAANAYMLSTVERIEGRYDAALALAAESEVAAGASGKGEWVGWSALVQGAARHATGDLADAVSACEEALETFRRIEGRWGEAFATESLALAVGAQGDRRRAAALHARGVGLRHEIGSPTGIENDFIGLADLAHAAGNFRVAAVLLGAAEAHEARFGIAPLADTPTMKQRILVEVKDRLGAAAFQPAWAEGRELSHDEAVAAALAVAATLA